MPLALVLRAVARHAALQKRRRAGKLIVDYICDTVKSVAYCANVVQRKHKLGINRSVVHPELPEDIPVAEQLSPCSLYRAVGIHCAEHLSQVFHGVLVAAVNDRAVAFLRRDPVGELQELVQFLVHSTQLRHIGGSVHRFLEGILQLVNIVFLKDRAAVLVARQSGPYIDSAANARQELAVDGVIHELHVTLDTSGVDTPVASLEHGRIRAEGKLVSPEGDPVCRLVKLLVGKQPFHQGNQRSPVLCVPRRELGHDEQPLGFPRNAVLPVPVIRHIGILFIVNDDEIPLEIRRDLGLQPVGAFKNIGRHKIKIGTALRKENYLIFSAGNHLEIRADTGHKDPVPAVNNASGRYQQDIRCFLFSENVIYAYARLGQLF